MAQMTENDNSNRISALFVNKTIFITGGTGFLGKVLIEKLLRSCSGLKKIYILLRPKYNKNSNERLREIFKEPLFELVKQQGESVFAKVEAIAGDLSAPNLGLSDSDRKKLVDEIEIVYHSGASVKFDEPFKNAVLLNVRGTKLMLELAKESKNLMIFCYVSTAYCHEDQEVLLEKIYPRAADPYRIIDTCEWLNKDSLDVISSRIRGCRANNYTFTKALSEALIEDRMEDLPVIIQRPSVVVPTWKEPIPGWIDNLNGPVGLLVAAGKGVVRTMCGRADYFLDYIPVDLAANGLICTVYDYLTHRSRRVYNLTGSDEIKVTFGKLYKTSEDILKTKTPFSLCLWYPGGHMTQSRIIHNVQFFFFQLLPALFIDLILSLCGIKPFLLHVQKRVWNGYKILEYYTNRRWSFNKENTKILRSSMNTNERMVFKVDSDGFELDSYLLNCIKGARRYILKEPDSNMSVAMRRMKVMWFIDFLCKLVLLIGLLYYVYQKLAFFK